VLFGYYRQQPHTHAVHVSIWRDVYHSMMTIRTMILLSVTGYSKLVMAPCQLVLNRHHQFFLLTLLLRYSSLMMIIQHWTAVYGCCKPFVLLINHRYIYSTVYDWWILSEIWMFCFLIISCYKLINCHSTCTPSTFEFVIMLYKLQYLLTFLLIINWFFSLRTYFSFHLVKLRYLLQMW